MSAPAARRSPKSVRAVPASPAAPAARIARTLSPETAPTVSRTAASVTLPSPTAMTWSRSVRASRTLPRPSPGHGQDGVGVGLDLLALADVGEVLGDPLGGHGPEIEPLAPRQDRRRKPLGLGRREDELDVLGRLFEGLQEGVEGALGEHVDFVDVVDLVAGPCGAVMGVVAQDPDVLDAGVGGAVDLQDVDVVAAVDRLADVALAAGLGRGAFLAVQGPGQDAGHRGLADAARAAEEVGVGDAVLLDGALQGARDGLLADDLVKGRRAITTGQDRICHGSPLPGHFRFLIFDFRIARRGTTEGTVQRGPEIENPKSKIRNRKSGRAPLFDRRRPSSDELRGSGQIAPRRMGLPI